MARGAFQSGMRAGQREAGLPIMIEAPKGPTVRVMATIASLPQRQLMERILVAVRACRRRLAIGIGAMALFTWHGRVKSDQGKICNVVIERYLSTPARLIVASLTVLPELTFVGIVRPMTSIASRRQLILIEVAGMTTLTFYARVRSPEWKLRDLRMIERDFGPLRCRVT